MVLLVTGDDVPAVWAVTIPLLLLQRVYRPGPGAPLPLAGRAVCLRRMVSSGRPPPSAEQHLVLTEYDPSGPVSSRPSPAASHIDRTGT